MNIQPQALADAEEAAAWYDAQQVGLGLKFALELDAAIERAAANPTIYETVHGPVRRVLLRRFPYSIYFIYENGEVEVFAILHQQRAPNVWRNRAS